MIITIRLKGENWMPRVKRMYINEMGKPIKEGVVEVLSAADNFNWYAEEAKRVYGETIPSTFANKRLHVGKAPVGVTAAITPWNFPISMVARKLAPALAQDVLSF